MPVKNAEPFLEECLDSIIDQTYSNWELIAIDDHSDDNSYNTLLGYSFKDDRIKVKKNNGNGIIEALRLAFNESTGKFISRMDADDIMVREKLAVLHAGLTKFGEGFLSVGLVEYFAREKLGMGYKIYETWLNSLTYHGINFEEIYKECVIPSPCWMVHRTELIRAGAFENDVYPEDYDLAFRFYKEGLKPIPCKFILHKWRDHESRASRNNAHYQDNTFLSLKINHFMELDRDPARPLVLWGAGKRGKALSKLLIEKEVDFFWVSNNIKKHGVNIYGRIIKNVAYVEALTKPQIIINVSGPDDQNGIRAYLNASLLASMEDYFFFC